jgi:hypothetical protein
MKHIRLPKIVQGLAIAVLAVAGAEVFLQLTVSPTIEHSHWYTGGIHTPHDKYEFVFTPNYSGWMRHSDNVFLEELTLDPHGFRQPAKHPDSKQDVLLLGGRSMAFSYGLRDEHALPRAIGDALTIPSSVYSASWPGFDTFRIFHAYRESLEPKIDPRIAVIFFWEETLTEFATIPHYFDEFVYSGDETPDLFRYFDDIAIAPPTGRGQLLLGDWYYKSMIGHKLGNELDNLGGRVARTMRRLDLWERPAEMPLTRNAADEEHSAERFAAWTAYLTKYFGGSDKKLLFVFLPRKEHTFTPARYDRATSLLPNGARYLDLNRSLGQQISLSDGYLAAGHYTADSMALIGRTIAREINAIQGAATTMFEGSN